MKKIRGRQLRAEIAGIRIYVAVKAPARKMLKQYRAFISQISERTERKPLTEFGGDSRLAVWRGNLYAFENALRKILSRTLAAEGGFLLHASGVAHGGRAFVFCGKSGSGKSTLAAAFPAREVLSDELVALRKTRGRFYAHSTPFRGMLGKPGGNFGGRLEKLFFIEQGADFRTSKIPKRDALGLILKNTLYFGTRDGSCDKCGRGLIGSAAEIARSDAARRLIFSLGDIGKIKKLALTRGAKIKKAGTK